MAERAVMVPVPLEAVGDITGTLDFGQEKKKEGVTFFGEVGGRRVRLKDVLMNVLGLAALLQPLFAGGEKVTWMREVLQCAAGRGQTFGCRGASNEKRNL